MSRIQLERAGSVATLWLDRPDKRNAMDAEMMQELGAALDEVGGDGSVRVVVLRGRGAMFSSGIDHSLLGSVLGAVHGPGAKTPFLHLHHQLQDTFHRLSRLHQPVIAALHGAAVGMACELALAADIRIATEDTVMGLPEIAFGIIPDVGGTTRLVRCVGEPRARELVLTGRLVKARTAERYGMVHDVVADLAALDQRVQARAELLASHSPTALGLAKVLVQASGDSDAATSFRLEGAIQQGLLGQPELATRFAAGVAFIKAQMQSAE
jgi:enoyl-CoA hydratase/carnithine racemase